MLDVNAGNGGNYDDIEVDNYDGRSNPRVQIQPFCPRRAIVLDLFFHVNLLVMNLYLSKFFPYYKMEHRKILFLPLFRFTIFVFDPIYQQGTVIISPNC